MCSLKLGRRLPPRRTSGLVHVPGTHQAGEGAGADSPPPNRRIRRPPGSNEGCVGEPEPEIVAGAQEQHQARPPAGQHSRFPAVVQITLAGQGGRFRPEDCAPTRARRSADRCTIRAKLAPSAETGLGWGGPG